jgi:glycosyltransferase involved in cell wall biosynthesis
MDGMNICFYSGVRRPEHFDMFPGYRTDVEILYSLGFTVHASKRLLDVSFKSDAYVACWPTSGFLPMLLAKVRRKPFLLVAGGDDVVTEYPNFGFWERKPVVRQMIRNTVRQADHVIAVSQHAAQQVRTLGAENVSVVYKAIDADKYTPGTKSETLDFLCIVASLSSHDLRRQPVATVIRALPQVLVRHPRTRLLLIGKPGDGSQQLRDLADRLRVSNAVVFLGSVSAEEKLKHLQAAFGYVQPTTHEAFGAEIAEAMSCGLPVITSPVAAVPEVVGDCGLFADPLDDNGFAAQMVHLLDNPKLAADLGTRARNRVVENFSVEQRQKGFQRIYASIPHFSM